jgi:hypothetical protein
MTSLHSSRTLFWILAQKANRPANKIAGFANTALFFSSLLLPQPANPIVQIAQVLALGEMPTVFWFLIRALWPPPVIAQEVSAA